MKPVDEDFATKLLLTEAVSRMRTWLDRAIHCMNQLDDVQVWYRPNAQSNAIGNMVLHLVGNLKQWILGGINDLADTRDRPAEFDAEAGYTRQELCDLLKETVESACLAIQIMPAIRVTEMKHIQNMDVTLANAVVMAVSHLGLHVGQIQYVGKMLLSEAYVGSSEPRESRHR